MWGIAEMLIKNRLESGSGFTGGYLVIWTPLLCHKSLNGHFVAAVKLFFCPISSVRSHIYALLFYCLYGFTLTDFGNIVFRGFLAMIP